MANGHSLEVAFRHGHWGLFIRSYTTYERPEYLRLCNVSDEMASFLVAQKLAGDLSGQVGRMENGDEHYRYGQEPGGDRCQHCAKEKADD